MKKDVKVKNNKKTTTTRSNDVNIITHKGFWKSPKEQNSLQSYQDAFEAGFGIEFDLRDHNQHIIVSHDPITNNHPFLLFSDLLQLYSEKGRGLPLMLNIKSSEISASILKQLNDHNITNYYLFDMAIPDLVKYSSITDQSLCRVSEIEYSSPKLERLTCGFLVDSFEGSFIELLQQRKEILKKEKPIFLISPELHGESHLKYWNFLKDKQTSRMHLCTDLPEEARSFFNE